MTDSILQLYLAMEPKVQLQFGQGEISRLDVILFEQQMLKYQKALKEYQIEVNTSTASIRQLAFLPDEAVLLAPALLQMPIDSFLLDEQHNIYIHAFQLKQETLRKEVVQLEQQMKIPGLTIGYFMQSLEKEYAFQGLTLGIGIPLDKRASKAKLDQFELEKEQLENEKMATTTKFALRIKALKQNLLALQDNIDLYEQVSQPRQAQLLELAKLQYDRGELDFLAFRQIQESILLEQQQYLEQLKAFNMAVLELSYLTQKMN